MKTSLSEDTDVCVFLNMLSYCFLDSLCMWNSCVSSSESTNARNSMRSRGMDEREWILNQNLRVDPYSDSNDSMRRAELVAERLKFGRDCLQSACACLYEQSRNVSSGDLKVSFTSWVHRNEALIFDEENLSFLCTLLGVESLQSLPILYGCHLSLFSFCSDLYTPSSMRAVCFGCLLLVLSISSVHMMHSDALVSSSTDNSCSDLSHNLDWISSFCSIVAKIDPMYDLSRHSIFPSEDCQLVPVEENLLYVFEYLSVLLRTSTDVDFQLLLLRSWTSLLSDVCSHSLHHI